MNKQNFIIIFFIVSLLSISLIYGCGSQAPNRVEFISDYSKLQKNPDYEGSLIYFNPDKPLKNYTRVIINPVQVRLSTKGKMWDVEKSKLYEISQYFYNQLVSELTKSGYKIVNTPAPETLILRVALTEVAPTRILNSPRGLMVLGVSLGGTSCEGELIDALSGEVVAAASESQKGEKVFYGMTEYGNTQDVIDRWVKRLVIRMDKEHGKKRK